MTNTPAAISEDLLGNDSQGKSRSNTPDVCNNAVVFTTTKLVTTEGDYDFDYHITAPDGYDACAASSLCFDCVYDLVVTVQDECGEYLYPTSLPIQKIAIGLTPDGTCGTAVEGDVEFTLTDLVPGTYTITKVLTLRESAIDDYKNIYQNTTLNGCIDKPDDYITAAQGAVDASVCELSCDDCISALGTEASFIAAGGTAAEYAQLLASCDELCSGVNNCQMSYLMMLVDVTPGGQYATYTLGSDQLTVEYAEALSIFQQYNRLRLPPQVQNPLSTTPFRNPVITENGNTYYEYRDPDGKRSEVDLIEDINGAYFPKVHNNGTIKERNDGSKYVYPEELLHEQDFIDRFKPSWARSLVEYHPEWCYYDKCRENDEIPSGATISSNDFDLLLLKTATFANAETEFGSFSTPTNKRDWLIDADPFFKSGGLGFSKTGDMENRLDNYLTGNSSTSPFDIFETVAITQSTTGCGNLFDPSVNSDIITCIKNEYSGGAAFDPSDLFTTGTTVQIDERWQVFRTLYLSAKQRILEEIQEENALTSCAAYNGCFGEELADFYPELIQKSAVYNVSISPFSSSSPIFDLDQPCNWFNYQLYAKKIKRFPSLDDHGNADEPAETADALVDQLNADWYRQTGQCPLLRDMQMLLNGMAVKGDLLATGPIALQTVNEFNEILYNAIIDGQSSTFTEIDWETAITSGDLYISFTTTESVSSSCLNNSSYDKL